MANFWQRIFKKKNPGGGAEQQLSSAAKNHSPFWNRRAVYASIFVIILTLVSSPKKTSFPDLQARERAEETVVMPVDITIVNEAETERARAAARALVSQTYVLDLTIGADVNAALITNIEEWAAAFERGDSASVGITDQRAIAMLQSAREREAFTNRVIALSNDLLKHGIIATQSDLNRLAQVKHIEWIERTASGVAVSEKYSVDPLPLVKEAGSDTAITLRVQQEISRAPGLAERLIREHLPVNLTFDAQATRKRETEEVAKVSERTVSFYAGDELFHKGETINSQQAMVLQELRMLQAQINWVSMIGLLVFYGLVVIIFMAFLQRFFSEYYNDGAGLLLLGLLFALPLAILKGLHLYTALSSNIIYLMPIAGSTALVCLLFHPRLAIFFNVFTAASAAMLGGSAFVPFLVHWLAGTAVVFSMADIRRRTSILRAGLIVAATMCFVLFIGKMIEAIPGTNRVLLEALGYSAVNGIFFTPIIVIGLLVFFEDIFHRPTVFRLLELSDLSNDVFKDMLLRASGTYQHSLTVGNLAEKAADEIGANALLARVGGYYHDIGKLGKPDYFAENQNYMDQNKHSKIKPSLSASVLKSHVKQGLEMAKGYGLPRIIGKIISQHHGTSVMQFFYHQALENADDEPVNREDYQYPGPKPQSREAAIVMLADSVEAAARTMKNPTPVHIEELVKKIVNGKFMEGELEECNLTLKDLQKIVFSFTRVLTSMYHTRVAYPDEMEIKNKEDAQNEKKQKKNQRNDSGS